MKRRSFLAAAAALASAPLVASNARAFGAAPSTDLLLPPDRTAHNILEVFMLGGVSPYESFYAVEDFGKDTPDPQQFYSFLESGDVQAALDRCGVSGGSDLLLPFAEDARGRQVSLGPFVQPLRARPDLLNRLRTHMTSHVGAPHEVGIPLALTGRVPGNRDLAGLGAHVQRFFGGESSQPVSYVLLPPSAVQRELVRAVGATGLHPGSTRPLQLRMDDLETALELMKRGTLGERVTSHDEAVRALEASYAKRLQFRGAPVRRAHLGEFSASRGAVESSELVAGLLGRLPSDPIVASVCGGEEEVDYTAMSLRLATGLLNEVGGARYVCVFDGGFGPQQQAGGYDTHESTPEVQALNLTSLLSSLASLVNRPGENDPAKLDLDRTLIILNTEFGRTPHVTGPSRGRGHWPNAFPVMMLGGPIRAQNRGIFGSMSPTAEAELAAAPSMHRMAALLSLGVWPFAQESFNVSDVPDGGDEASGVEWVLREYMGVRS